MRNQNSKIKSFKARDFNSCVLEQVNVDLLNCDSKKHLVPEYNSYHKGSRLDLSVRIMTGT